MKNPGRIKNLSSSKEWKK